MCMYTSHSPCYSRVTRTDLVGARVSNFDDFFVFSGATFLALHVDIPIVPGVAHASILRCTPLQESDMNTCYTEMNMEYVHIHDMSTNSVQILPKI